MQIIEPVAANGIEAQTVSVVPVADGKVMLAWNRRHHRTIAYAPIRGPKQPEETPVQAAVRLVKEWTGAQLRPDQLTPAGELLLYVDGCDRPPIAHSDVFTCGKHFDMQEAETIKLRWFGVGKLPEEFMMGSDVRWVRDVGEGFRVNGWLVERSDDGSLLAASLQVERIRQLTERS